MKPLIKICVICKNNFLAKHKQNTCSDECRKQRIKNLAKKYREINPHYNTKENFKSFWKHRSVPELEMKLERMYAQIEGLNELLGKKKFANFEPTPKINKVKQ